jgi:hypothetical protein
MQHDPFVTDTEVHGPAPAGTLPSKFQVDPFTRWIPTGTPAGLKPGPCAAADPPIRSAPAIARTTTPTRTIAPNLM